jgi:hypothetical protein
MPSAFQELMLSGATAKGSTKHPWSTRRMAVPFPIPKTEFPRRQSFVRGVNLGLDSRIQRTDPECGSQVFETRFAKMPQPNGPSTLNRGIAP